MTEQTKLPRDQYVLDLERNWRATHNPLYVWDAINRTLARNPPDALPPWCAEYLADAARRIKQLSNDARCGPRISTSEAMTRLVSVLGFARRGQKNAFSRYNEDTEAMFAALEFGTGGCNASEVARKRNVTLDRVQRILARGRRLMPAWMHVADRKVPRG